MTIQQAIEKAIEGGYKSPCCNRDIKLAEHLSEHQEMVLLDPLFWQALGKSRGWNNVLCMECGQKPSASCNSFSWKLGWLVKWHHFIGHLAEGKTIEQFFEQL